MKCPQNCPYSGVDGSSGANTSQAKRTIIRHPQGNYIALMLPLSIEWKSVVDGVEESSEQGILENADSVIVELSSGKRVYRYKPIIQNNLATIIDYGELPAGRYDITILVEWDGGLNHGRYKKRTILLVDDETAGGGQYENDEFNVLAVYPIMKGKTTAIILGDDDVTISEAGKFKGDDTPADDYADIAAIYGESSIEVGENDVTLTI